MKEKVLDYHSGKLDNSKPGKIGTEITKSLDNEKLSLAYTPGVAIPCLEIKKDSSKAYDYTNKGNSVAIITNGSAVLGLGNIGALAGKPVMEGKAVLFKHFADVDAVDVLIDSQDQDKIVKTVELISKTYGAINLEDIKAPECFYILEKLENSLDIPVFHDDQDGTAIVVSAGLLNALKIVSKNIEDVKIVISGAGAAGIACARLFVELGVKKENLILCDSQGVIHSKREVNEYKKEFAIETDFRELKEIIEDADVFVGVSKKDILTKEMLLSMNSNPIVFALSNPDPEIDYNLAVKTREDLIIATGRSDYPNQINNVLAFPGLFRGVLDSRAKKITKEMKLVAVYALAEMIEPTKERFIPDVFDKKVVKVVSEAVKSVV